ncbi:MAG TPA: winged helix-turn-helix domain-containing protein [Pyrinomonadaceae bacterium]|nr:winged helix-turn-helix domain-containing protein [Pyrinomonadaceae bacterium]
MSPSVNTSYEFANFLLLPSEKVLFRDGELVSLTPKVFDTLEIFITNPRRLIAKNELMERLWPDNFVEESNLTSNIKMLRRALGDDAANPRFIETVPRRGYRFIAEVRTVGNEGPEEIDALARGRGAVSTPLVSTHSNRPTIAIAALLLVSGVGILGFWLSNRASGSDHSPILNSTFASEPFSTNGEVSHAVITPDGKGVIYTNGPEGKQSIWRRQLETGNNTEIVPPSEDPYVGLAVSPDGNTIYFARRPRSGQKKATFRVSANGGIPAKIIDDTEGWISISPNGKQISFVRCAFTDTDYCSLLVADADSGKNEMLVASRRRPIRIADNEFSPDGRSIAFAVGQSQNQANEFGLMMIELESGNERYLSPEKFFDIKNITFLHGENSILATASRVPNKHFRIWTVNTIGGEARTLTNDSESYGNISVPTSGDLLVATKIRQDFKLYEIAGENSAARQPLADASHVAFAPNGKVFFSSPMSGNDEIWSINRDGSGLRQLTNDAADEGVPTLSPRGDFIFFSSNRTGSSQVWRMKADGSDTKRITEANGGRPVAVTPDGKWVIYRHGIERTLWRVSTNGGDEEMIFAKSPHEIAVSEDGKLVAFFERSGSQILLVIASLETGDSVKSFTIADQTQEYNRLAWMPGGQAIVYVLSPENKTQSLWSQPLNSGSPRKIAELGTDRVNSLAVSPDGESFAIVQGGWKHDAVLFRGLK